MKKYFYLLSFFIFNSIFLFGQSPPESFKYQSIVRDASGSMLQNQSVNFQFTLIQGSVSGNTVYQEVFPVSTNSYGLVNLDIGTGSSVSGSFSSIDWSQGPYFIQTGLDITGGTNYSIMSTNELMSVPYALYAKTSGGGPPGPAGPQGAQGNPGIQGITGQDGNSGIVQQTVLNVGNSTCVNGGLLIESGLDLNNDGVLSSTEITSTGYVCNGDDALDNQNLTGATLSGTILQIDIDNGSSALVDLSSLQDGVDDADNDPSNEFNTGATLNGANLEISDGGGTQTVDLSSLSGTGSDNQNLTGATLTGTTLQIDIETGNSATVDLAALQDGVDDADNDPTNEYITSTALNGNNLEITDGGGTQTVDLCSLSGTGSDNQNLTGATLTGTTLQIDIETGNSATVDLAALQDGVDDADNDPTNEYITSTALNGNNLEITDGGGTQTVDLSSFADDGDWIVGSGIVYNITNNIGIGTSTPTAKLDLLNTDAINGIQIEHTGITGTSLNVTSSNTTNTSAGLGLTMAGPGIGISLQHNNNYAGEVIALTSTTNDYSGLQINHAGTGFGTSVFHTGTGYGHYIDMSNTTAANSNQAILGLHSGGTTTAAIRVGDFEYIGTTLYDHIGVFGYSNPGAGWGIGGQFQGGYIGVAGFGDDYGIVGFSGAVAAVFANGDLSASGVKAFTIDHPDDPENKLLKHFSIESNEVLNVYRGIAMLDNNGKAEIEMADYFEAININFSYQLTAIGTPKQPYVLTEIKNNKFIVAGEPNTKVSWLVIAERNDEYLKQNPEKRAVEVAKTGKEKGKYLMPELYNQPTSKGVFIKQEKSKRLARKKAVIKSMKIN
jgi:hypothetical protein